MSDQRPDRPSFAPIDHAPLYLGAGGILALAAALLLARDITRPVFLHTYLASFLFWSCVAIGSSIVVGANGGRADGEGRSTLPLVESAASTALLAPILFLPLMLERALPTLRSLLYLCCWVGCAWYLTVGSRRSSRTGRSLAIARLAPLSLLFLTLSAAGVDWTAALQRPRGVLFAAAMLPLGSYAASLALLTLVWLARAPTGEGAPPELARRGGVIAAVLWAALPLGQLLELAAASECAWRPLITLVAIARALVPCYLALARRSRPALLVLGSIGVLALYGIEIYCWLLPAVHPQRPDPSLLDLATWVGQGALWLAVLGVQLRRRGGKLR